MMDFGENTDTSDPGALYPLICFHLDLGTDTSIHSPFGHEHLPVDWKFVDVDFLLRVVLVSGLVEVIPLVMIPLLGVFLRFCAVGDLEFPPPGGGAVFDGIISARSALVIDSNFKIILRQQMNGIDPSERPTSGLFEFRISCSRASAMDGCVIPGMLRRISMM